MRRVLQLVALFVVVLLAAQPALAGMPCALVASTSGGCAPDCTVVMNQAAMSQAPRSGMSADCAMPAQLASNGCESNCCHAGLPQGVAQLATGVKSRPGDTVSLVLAPQMVAAATPAFAAPPPDYPSASGPARYILLQVFRI